MKMYKSNKIIIPKSFKSSDNSFTIKLKDSIHGYSEITKDKKVFVGGFPIFEIEIENTDRFKILAELKDKIVEIYKKGIVNKCKLNKSELVLFYYIKDAKRNITDKENNTLIIGYKDNTISIKNTILNFNTDCDAFEIEKNIEMYTNKTYDLLYKSFVNKCTRNKYNKFIMDITNLYMITDYEKTKKFIRYIESINGDILFLIDHADISYDKFVDIFGKKYKDSVVDKNKYLYPEQSLILYKIESILFK